MHDTDSEDLLKWPPPNSQETWEPQQLKELCENVKTYSEHATAEITNATLDHGFLMFRNASRHKSRPIQMITCQTTLTGHAEYFYFTQGKEVDGYYLLIEIIKDKIFNLDKPVSLSTGRSSHGGLGQQQTESRNAEQQQSTQKQDDGQRSWPSSSSMEPVFQQRTPRMKPNFENAPYVFHRTIWEPDQ